MLVSLCLLLLVGGIGEVAGSAADPETSQGNGFQAWVSSMWVQTTRADFEAGIPVQADTRSSTDNVVLAREDRIFAFQGGTTNFWRYGVPGRTWASMAPVQNAVGGGGSLAYDGVRYIYAFRGGGNNRTFWRYDTINDAWLQMANALGIVGDGGALTYDGSGSVYALEGNGTRAFWRYNIATDTWIQRRNTPAAVGAGGALAYDGVRYVYAFQGNGRVAFWRYDTTNNTWTAMNNAPAAVRGGGSLAFDGTRYIYALQGNNRMGFWRYDTIGGSWVAMANAPARVGPGGALAYAGLGYVYAFRGNGTPAFWRYDALGNSWTVMASALGNVAAGGALAFVGSSAYVSWATMASQVSDAGRVGARWDALIWDESLPPGADITFEVRTSDTPFTADSTMLAWTLVGGISPVVSGLPSGRYMQWRATLTTADTSVTPLLQEVRVYYY